MDDFELILPERTNFPSLDMDPSVHSMMGMVNEAESKYKATVKALKERAALKLRGAADSIKAINPKFLPGTLLKLRKDFLQVVFELKAPEERKSYILHQMANVHDLDSLFALIEEVNYSQSKTIPKFIIPNSFKFAHLFQNKSILPADISVQDLESFFEMADQEFIYLQNNLSFKTISFSKIGGFFLDRSLNPTLLAHIKVHANKRGIPFTEEDDTSLSELSKIVKTTFDIMRVKKVDLSTAHIALVGPLGGSAPILSNLFADHIERITLIHHTPIESSFKLQDGVKQILREMKLSSSTSPLVQFVKNNWKKEVKFLDFLEDKETEKLLKCTIDLNEVSRADIVVLNSFHFLSFLDTHSFGPDAVLIDLCSPHPEILKLRESLRLTRPDVSYISKN